MWKIFVEEWRACPNLNTSNHDCQIHSIVTQWSQLMLQNHCFSALFLTVIDVILSCQMFTLGAAYSKWSSHLPSPYDLYVINVINWFLNIFSHFSISLFCPWTSTGRHYVCTFERPRYVVKNINCIFNSQFIVKVDWYSSDYTFNINYATWLYIISGQLLGWIAGHWVAQKWPIAFQHTKSDFGFNFCLCIKIGLEIRIQFCLSLVIEITLYVSNVFIYFSWFCFTILISFCSHFWPFNDN